MDEDQEYEVIGRLSIEDTTDPEANEDWIKTPADIESETEIHDRLAAEHGEG